MKTICKTQTCSRRVSARMNCATVLIGLFLMSGFSAFGGYIEKNDIPYYENEFPKSGNVDYINEQCKLDIYYPDDVKDFATVIFLHSGGLVSGQKFIPPELKGYKIGVVAVEYRFSGDKASCPDYINDAAAATAWVMKNIASFGGDPKKIFLCGHSAGAYLAAMVGLDRSYLKQFGQSPDSLMGLWIITGQMTTHFQILNERRKQAPDTPLVAIDNFAPIFHTRADAPMTMVFAGEPDRDLPARTEESAFFVAYATKVANHKDTQFYTFKGFGHSSIRHPAYRLLLMKLAELKIIELKL